MAEIKNTEIKFGTDGWRGVISDNFTFKNVGIVAQAVSEWINRDIQGREKTVVVGYDTRFLSEEYARLVGCVLAQNGINVFLSNTPIPTPALSYGVIRTRSVAGIMITASHNPAKFNGIKIKTDKGGGAPAEITNKVEGYLYQTPVQMMDFRAAAEEQKIKKHDFKVDYLKFIKGYIDLKRIRKAKFKVLTDAMHGSGNGLMAQILKGTNIRLSLMRDDVNPSFDGGKPEPVVEYLSGILKRVRKEKFDLGLVLDGDADRIAAVACGGEFIHPQKILGLLALHLIRNRGRTGGIVKTICGTTMIDNIAKKLGVQLYETPVGFKYISDLMIVKNIVAGGEEAGGMGVQGFIPERDGTLAGLLLLEMMVYQKKNIKRILLDMEKEFGRYYYERCDLELGQGRFDAEKVRSMKTLLGQHVVEVKDFDGIKLICADDSWLMLRPSGTEPLVRAYSEAKTAARASALIRYGRALLQEKQP